MNKLIVLSIVFIMAGCVSFPKPQESVLLGECFQLQQAKPIWSGGGGLYKSEFFISLPSGSTKKLTYLGDVNAGTRVIVHKVYMAANGSVGRFIRVQVRIIDGRYFGYVAGVPIKGTPYHPKEKWTTTYTTDPNALEFDPTIVKPCSSIPPT